VRRQQAEVLHERVLGDAKGVLENARQVGHEVHAHLGAEKALEVDEIPRGLPVAERRHVLDPHPRMRRIAERRSENPAPDPLLYTAGGPGYSSLSSVWGFAGSPFVDARDVVILEQRGNLYAEPSLDCDLTVLREETEGKTPCLDSLRARGIDPTYYTTASIVADIDALRRVLDYDKWNLYGVSYSTRLMLLSMSLHSQGIRSVMLQSVSPPTETPYAHDPEHAARALHVMFDDCLANPACAQAYPDLESQLYTLVRRLNADPVAVEFVGRDTGESVSVPVDGRTLLGWMVTDAFYEPAYPPYKTAYLPLLIDQVERGNTDLLYAWR